MELRFKYQERTISLNVGYEDSFHKIKKSFSEKTNLKDFSFYFENDLLDEATILQETEITSESIIFVKDELSPLQKLIDRALELDLINGPDLNSVYHSLFFEDYTTIDEQKLLFEIVVLSDSISLDDFLLYAVIGGNSDLVGEAIYLGANIYQNVQYDLLVLAVEYGHYDVVKQLIENDRRWLFMYDEAFFLAVYNGYNQIAELLIDQVNYFGTYLFHSGSEFSYKTITGDDGNNLVQRSALLYSILSLKTDIFGLIISYMGEITIDHMRLVFSAIDDIPIPSIKKCFVEKIYYRHFGVKPARNETEIPRLF